MAPNRLNARWLRPALATLALAALALLGGCGGGSGAPNNPYAPKPVAPGPLLIIPSSITVYANTPAVLTIIGGVAPYFVTSSNPALLPLASSSSTGTVVLLPGNVAMTASVLITVTDTVGTQAQATATVQPAPIFNTLTITPASAACGANTICSGQTGTAAVTVTGPGGAGIPNRQVRFDVISGAFAIQSNDPANPLVASITVVSDQFGHAQVILQANVAAPTQPAQLRATDVTSGEQQTAQFIIVQTINGSTVLSVIPATATVTGPDKTTCSSGFTVTYYIYGGTPPYTVASTFPNAVGIFNVPVLMSGGAFTAVTNGTCVNPLTFTIRDATGLQTTATLLNLVGTAAPAPMPISVAPSSYSVGPGLNSCTGKTFNFTISGGTAPFGVASSGAVIVPNPVTTSPGTFGVSNFADASGKHAILVGDASSPQLTAGASVTCN